MPSFKLLAIQPHKGCNRKFLKNLTPELLYPLYNSYTFYNDSGDPIKKSSDGRVTSIGKNIKFPIGIFNRTTADGQPLQISVSAIVGKNGSGKSSLMELFFACVYLYSVNHEILKPNIKSLNFSTTEFQTEYIELKNRQKNIITQRNQIIRALNSQDKKMTVEQFEELRKQIQGLFQQESLLNKRRDYINSEIKSNIQSIKDIRRFERELKASVYFENDDSFYCLQLQYDNVQKKSKNSIVKIAGHQQDGFKSFEITPKPEELAKHFFYTISINYSHYALNSLVIGDWIKALFHKNDGYTTPIVINPMRKNGNFDINSEMNFARYRLLTNKLLAFDRDTEDPKNVFITDTQNIKRVVFTLNRPKINAIPKFVRFTKKGLTSKPRERNLLTTFLSDYFNDSEEYDFYHKDIPIKEIIANYIINKIDTIPKKYAWFGQGYQFSENTPFIENEKFFNLLKEDRSHVTYKLKQAVNFLKYTLTDNANQFLINKGQLENKNNIRFELSLSEIMSYMRNPSGREIMAYLPPSIFDIDFEISNEAGSTSFFSGLSSGEQQLVHTVQAVVYHLNNLQSAHFGEGRRSKFHAVNIIYDEIELYFHPDYQRRFLSDLLKEFERFYVGEKSRITSVNILLLTHSPFILSDIPKENIMLLELNKKTRRSVPAIVASETFAANINDLLADGFFLTEALMGQFAENEIKEAINRIKKNQSSDQDKEILDKVGDTFLRASLKNFKKRHDD